MKCSHRHYWDFSVNGSNFSVNGRHFSVNGRHFSVNGRHFIVTGRRLGRESAASLERTCRLRSFPVVLQKLPLYQITFWRRHRPFEHCLMEQQEGNSLTLPQVPTRWRVDLQRYSHLAAATASHSQLRARSGPPCHVTRLSRASACGHRAQGEEGEMDIYPVLPFWLEYFDFFSDR